MFQYLLAEKERLHALGTHGSHLKPLFSQFDSGNYCRSYIYSGDKRSRGGPMVAAKQPIEQPKFIGHEASVDDAEASQDENDGGDGN